MGSYFFLILSISMMIKLVDKGYPISCLFLTALITGVGILYKTTLAAAPIFFTLLVLFNSNKYGLLRSFKLWFLFAVISFLPLLLNQYYIYDNWELQYEDNIRETFEGRVSPDEEKLNEKINNSDKGLKYTFTYKIITVFIAFPLIPLSFMGLRLANLELSNYKKYSLFFIFISCFFIVSLLSIYVSSPRWTLILLIPVYVLLSYSIKTLEIFFIEKTSYNTNNLIWIFVALHSLVSITVASNDADIRELLGFWSKN